MAKVRLIARLDIKGPNLIKGVHLEGLRVLGDPQQFARDYYEQGADELIYIDIVASLYGRNNLSDIVSRTARDVFVPLTVGGGVSIAKTSARGRVRSKRYTALASQRAIHFCSSPSSAGLSGTLTG